MRLQPIVFLSILIPLSLGGCVTDSEDELSVMVEVPPIGSTFHYTASDGSRLTVTVLEGKSIRDAAGENVSSFLTLNLSLNPAKAPGLRIDLWEHVDARGSVVRQDLHCVFSGHLTESTRGTDNERNCKDPLTQTLFGPAGLPAAIGIGPLWSFGGLPLEGFTWQTLSPIAGALSMDFAPPQRLDDECVGAEISGDSGALIPAEWMPLILDRGRFVLCRGIPLPTQFSFTLPLQAALTDAPHPTFTLDHWKRGDTVPDIFSVTTEGGGCWTGEGSTADPLIGKPDSRPPITPHEAATVAKEDPQFALWYQAHPDAKVVEASYITGRSGWLLGGTYRFWDVSWELTFTDDSRAAYLIEVVKRFELSKAEDAPRTTVFVERQETFRWEGPLPSTLLDGPRLTLAQALERSRPIFSTSISHIMMTPEQGVGALLSRAVTVEDRYRIKVIFTQGSENQDENGNATDHRLWWFEMDSRSGCFTEVLIDEAGLEAWDEGVGPLPPPLGQR